MINIQKEIILYPHIEKLLNGRGSYILQNEVNFLEQLKAIDLLAKDENYYYVIEVKYQDIEEDDYWNLDYIIKNNNIGKPMKGILFGGSCNNKEPLIYEEIRKNSNIELIIFNLDIIESSIIPKIEHSREYYNKKEKFWIYIFIDLSDIDIKDIKINGNCIEVSYKLNRKKTFSYRAYIDDDNNIVGDIYIDEFDFNFGKELNVKVEENIPINKVRSILYSYKLKELSRDKLFSHDMKSTYYDEIYFSIRHILKFMSLDTLVNNLDYHYRLGVTSNNRNLEYGLCFRIVNFNYNGKIFIDVKYIECIETEKLSFDKKDNCILRGLTLEFLKRYNRITYLDFTNILIDDILYIPNKKIIYNTNTIELSLEIEIEINSTKEKIIKKYTITTFNSVTNADFYLLTNFNIIMKFEGIIKERIKGSVYKIFSYKNNFSINKIRDKDIKELKRMPFNKTIRELINEYKND
ncbi:MULTISPECIES: hypothetical protein [unclassified Clostridium]|uniref:hypothetical protein n=1 Tax=unclassified Clostridium TaxID=2614128 RepID=UPI003216850B